MAAHVAGGVHRPIVPVRLVAGGRTLVTYAMLDTAANRSAVLPSLLQELGVSTRKVVTKLTAFDN